MNLICLINAQTEFVEIEKAKSSAGTRDSLQEQTP